MILDAVASDIDRELQFDVRMCEPPSFRTARNGELPSSVCGVRWYHSLSLNPPTRACLAMDVLQVRMCFSRPGCGAPHLRHGVRLFGMC